MKTTNAYTAPGASGLEGHYAGIISRFVAFVIDIAAIALTFAIAGTVLEYVLTILVRHEMHLRDARVVADVPPSIEFARLRRKARMIASLPVVGRSSSSAS